jgi:hypothetical protein
VYMHMGRVTLGAAYASRDEARGCEADNHIACINVRFDEGDGL